MRIITVTLNPALDKTATVDELRPGALNRLGGVTVDAGGKGVNVSKMVAALGGVSMASGFVGGGSGEAIAMTLDGMGVGHDFVRIAASTRTNLKVLDRGSRLTELNEPGPTVTAAEVEALWEKLRSYADPKTLFVFSGSLPDGVDSRVYADLVRMVRGVGATAYVDADGEAFAHALEAAPDFIKPNRFELLQYFAVHGDADHREIVSLCRRILDRGVKRIALSMGADGALFVSADRAFLCPGLRVEALSSVGAGDSMVGAIAFAAVSGMSWRESAALAMAASAGAVTTVGTKPPSRRLVDSLLPMVEFVEF